MRRLLIHIAVLLCAAACIAATTPANAGVVEEARVGILAQAFGGYAPRKEQGAALNLELVFSSPDFLKAVGSPRPLIGAVVAFDSDATSMGLVALEWKTHVAERIYIAGALGGAVHNGETERFDPVEDAAREGHTQFLGCRALFYVGVDFGYDLSENVSAAVHWQHISNAGLCDNNEGLDHLGGRLSYRF